MGFLFVTLCVELLEWQIESNEINKFMYSGVPLLGIDLKIPRCEDFWKKKYSFLRIRMDRFSLPNCLFYLIHDQSGTMQSHSWFQPCLLRVTHFHLLPLLPKFYFPRGLLPGIKMIYWNKQTVSFKMRNFIKVKIWIFLMGVGVTSLFWHIPRQVHYLINDTDSLILNVPWFSARWKITWRHWEGSG